MAEPVDLRAATAAGVTELAMWAADRAATSGAGLPRATRRKALAVVLDDLAAALTAGQEQPVRAAAEIGARRGAGLPEATILVNRERAERGWAAASNAIAVTTPELDEGYRPTSCHGGLYTVPAAVAEAEATGGTLADVVDGVALGYEIATRLARAFSAPLPAVLHPHAVFSPVGAAAAVAVMRRISGRELEDTLTAAITMAMNGPFGHAVDGSQVRNAWPGAGAWLGFAAADWASAGLSGGPASVYEVLGRALRGTPAVEQLTAGLGKSYAVDDGYHKPYGCCQYSHSMVEAALQVHAESPQPVEPAEVRKIVLEAHPWARELTNTAPHNTLAAKFSLPHIAATVLANGTAGPDAFGAASLSDLRVKELRERTEIIAYEPIPAPPHDRPARITVEWADGSTTSAEALSARGAADRPLTESELLSKITAMVGEAAPDFRDTAAELLAGGVAEITPWRDVLARLLSTEPVQRPR